MAEKRKLKIAFLSYNSGRVSRGVETFVHELANALTNLGHQVVVYQSGRALLGALYKTVIIKDQTEPRAAKSYKPFNNYHALLVKDFTKRTLKAMEPDVDIVYPTNGQWQAVLTRLWCLQKHKKMIISGQSGPGWDDKINLFTFPHRFIALTDYQQKWARKVNSLVRTEKISNGINLEKFSEEGKPYALSLPKPIILNASAMVEKKRQDLLIKAVSKLKEGSLVLVGSGEEEDKLKTLCQNLIPGRYKILSLPYNQMPAIYRACDVFAFPTVPWESFGIVLLEAMASGLPVVATDDPIRREIVGGAGLFVDPKDSNNFALALKKTLAKDWKNLPRKQAEKYAWDKIAQRYEALFLKITK